MRSLFFLSLLALAGSAFLACGGDSSSSPTASDGGGGGGGGGGAGGGGGGGNTDGGGGGGGNADGGGGGGGSSTLHHPPSIAPTKTCSYTPDADGFFSLTSPMGKYSVRLPKGYDKTKATPVVVGEHGCGDNAGNFATWASAPYNDVMNMRQNDFQSYIGIAVEDSAGGCWDIGHGDKVLAALDDAATCFYVDQAHVAIAGYSSGAGVAYQVGLAHAERFSGILIEDGGLYDTGSAESSLLANAAWKINIAHMAHDSDPDYTLAKVQADWATITAAGFPLQTSHVPGTHDGTSKDWYGYLLPKMTAWSAP